MDIVNTTIPTTIATPTPSPTPTLIDMYQGGVAPPELGAFLFFVVLCGVIAIWVMWLINEGGEM
jgi:hypothetical protein